MANYFSTFYKNYNKTLDRVTLADSDNTLFGSDVVWVLATPATARTITIGDVEEKSANDNKGNKKWVLIKCAVNCSVNNITIINSAGTTLKTLSLDYSSNTVYIACRLTDALVWELA